MVQLGVPPGHALKFSRMEDHAPNKASPNIKHMANNAGHSESNVLVIFCTVLRRGIDRLFLGFLERLVRALTIKVGTKTPVEMIEF